MIYALSTVRNNMRNLTHYNNISFPLVYTQTVTVAVYGYFAFCLIGHQFYTKDVDVIVPFLTILRFIFGVGWLKVAEDLNKPFGSDDDDVELIDWLQRHIRLVSTVTDHATVKQPLLSWEKDESTLTKTITVCNRDKPVPNLAKRNVLKKIKTVLPCTSDDY